MKRTNIVLDEELVAEAKKATGIKTTRELVDTALRELLRQKDIRRILELRGEVEWEGDLTEMRRLRTFE